MIFLFFVYFLIATAQLVNKYILISLPVDLFLFIRMTASGLILFFLYSNRENFESAKSNIWLIFIVVLTTTFIPSLLRGYVFQRIPVSRAAFWGALEPFSTSIWMHILYNQKLNRNQFFGCLLGFVSSFIFIVMQSRESILSNRLFTIGDFAQIVSVFISRFGWIQAREIIMRKILEPRQLNAYSFLISGFLSLVLYNFRGGPLQALHVISGDGGLIVTLLYTIIIGNIIAYGLYTKALKTVSMTYISVAGLSVPFFVHILSCCIGFENFSKAFFISIGLLMLALYIFQLPVKSDNVSSEKDVYGD